MWTLGPSITSLAGQGEGQREDDEDSVTFAGIGLLPPRLSLIGPVPREDHPWSPLLPSGRYPYAFIPGILGMPLHMVVADYSLGSGWVS